MKMRVHFALFVLFLFFCDLVVQAQTPGRGTVTIAGVEKYKTYMPSGCRKKNCSLTVWDKGEVLVTVNGFSRSITYGSGSTADGIARGLAYLFSPAAGSPVSATVRDNVITLVATANGSGTNYPIITSVSYDAANFEEASFSANPSGLSGGSDASVSSPQGGLGWGHHGKWVGQLALGMPVSVLEDWPRVQRTYQCVLLGATQVP